jgi:hypothetical protein
MPEVTQETYRLEAIKIYLKSFKEQTDESIEYIDEAADLITKVYFRWVNEVIRPSIHKEKLIQIFKVCATTELSVLTVEPIKGDDEEKTKFLNCSLAFFMAVNMLLDWSNEQTTDKPLNKEKCWELIEKDSDIDNFVTEHTNWLMLVNPQFFNPIFYNSQLWRLFYYLLKVKTKDN